MNEDKIIKKLIEHDDRLERIEETMATKKGIDRVMNVLDEVLTINRRLDQERIFTNERIKHLEEDVRRNTKDIVKLKNILKVA